MYLLFLRLHLLNCSTKAIYETKSMVLVYCNYFQKYKYFLHLLYLNWYCNQHIVDYYYGNIEGRICFKYDKELFDKLYNYMFF